MTRASGPGPGQAKYVLLQVVGVLLVLLKLFVASLEEPDQFGGQHVSKAAPVRGVQLEIILGVEHRVVERPVVVVVVSNGTAVAAVVVPPWILLLVVATVPRAQIRSIWVQRDADRPTLPRGLVPRTGTVVVGYSSPLPFSR